MILDTTFLVDFLRERGEAAGKLAELEKNGESIFTTAVTVFEITQGTRGMKEEEEVADFLDAIEVLPLGKASAISAGRIQKKLKQTGLAIQPEDAMIAGIALAKNQPLLTRNISHFSRIKGLNVQTY